MDIVSRQVRSRMMAAVPQKHSRPELIVRKLAYVMGFRFRLHVRKLPGSPDLVFPKLRKAVFVHGCFWHRHGCLQTTTPSTRQAFWEEKFATNVARDRRSTLLLRRLGWQVLVIWECQTRRLPSLERHLARFLERSAPNKPASQEARSLRDTAGGHHE